MSKKTKHLISLYIATLGGSTIGTAMERSKITGVYDVYTFIAFVIASVLFAASGIIANDLD